MRFFLNDLSAGLRENRRFEKVDLYNGRIFREHALNKNVDLIITMFLKVIMGNTCSVNIIANI